MGGKGSGLKRKLNEYQEFWLGCLCETEWKRVSQERQNEHIEKWTGGDRTKRAQKKNLEALRQLSSDELEEVIQGKRAVRVRVGRGETTSTENLDNALRHAQGRADGLGQSLKQNVRPYKLIEGSVAPKAYGQRERIMTDAQTYALKHYGVELSIGKIEKLWKAYRSFQAETAADNSPLNLPL